MMILTDFFNNTDTLVLLWLSVTLFCLILEIVTVNLVSIWFSFAALITMVFSLFIDIVWIQLTIFVIISIVSMLLTRPLVQKHFRQNETKTNFDLLIGAIGVVTVDILQDDRGEVRIDGKFWTAISQQNEVILKNERVKILAIDGVKLIVTKEKGE